MRYYLRFGGDINVTVSTNSDSKSKFLLECLVGSSDTDVLRSLSAREIDSNSQTRYDNILFFDAVESGNSDRVKDILLSKQIDVNLFSYKEQLTPLQIAVARNNLELTKLLIENGADVNYTSRYKYRDNSADNPIVTAIKNNNYKIA